jgi:hypothetical protein
MGSIVESPRTSVPGIFMAKTMMGPTMLMALTIVGDAMRCCHDHPEGLRDVRE